MAGFTREAAMKGHHTLRKYQIRWSTSGYWLARVPYGMWNRFDTWTEAAWYLQCRYEEKK